MIVFLIAEKYFVWEKHEIMHPIKESKTTLGQSANILRAGILSSDLKDTIVELLHQDLIPINLVNELIRFSDDLADGALKCPIRQSEADLSIPKTIHRQHLTVMSSAKPQKVAG